MIYSPSNERFDGLTASYMVIPAKVRASFFAAKVKGYSSRHVLDDGRDRLYFRTRSLVGTHVTYLGSPAGALFLIALRDVPLSIWATVKFRLAGARSAVVTVDGRRPVIVPFGSITCRRLFLRCKTVPVEIGAGKNASLVLGDRVFINTGATVVANKSIVIGDGCLIGDFVAIFDTDHHQLEPSRPTRLAPVRLGANVWVGRSATILPGVTIGDHSVIASGSIVSSDVPPKTLVAGVPARPIRTLDVPDDWRRE